MTAGNVTAAPLGRDVGSSSSSSNSTALGSTTSEIA